MQSLADKVKRRLVTFPRYGYELGVLLALLVLHGWLLRRRWPRAGAARLAAGASFALAACSIVVSPAVWSAAAEGNGQYLRAIALLWSLGAPFFLLGTELAARLPLAHQPLRRCFFRATLAAPAAAAGYGILLGRRDFRVREQRIVIPNLPAALDGLRCVQLTDIHYGPFLSAAELRRVVGLANELPRDFCFLTGDFISRTPEHLEECLRLLSALRTDAPVLGCMGNHESYAACETPLEHAAARLGWRFLRDAKQSFRFADAQLVIAGVDYQWKKHEYLRGAEQLREEGAFNLLLAHNPDVFPRAASLGFDLTIAGHTHGGQVDVELLDQHLNVVRVFTPYTNGLYDLAGKKCFVSAGVGTIGVPLRIGAPPEVASLTLCAS